MPSITSWMRIEPRSRNAEMNTSLQARIYDPLWLLARQWQFGEFQGEDNGSPVMARWRGETTRLNRYLPGAAGADAATKAQSFDGRAMPLETLVEREHVRPDPAATEKPEKWLFAVRAGQHFLRMLDQQPLSKSYRELFRSKFPFSALTADQRKAVDDAVAATTAWYREQLDTVIAKVIADLKAKGVAVNTVDTAPFQAMVDPVYADFSKQWGADFVQSVRKAASGG